MQTSTNYVFVISDHYNIFNKFVVHNNVLVKSFWPKSESHVETFADMSAESSSGRTAAGASSFQSPRRL